MSKLEEIRGYVSGLADETVRLAKEIWEYAELSYTEVRSSAALENALEKEGFLVEKGIAGMPTAFLAECAVGSGRPVIGFVGEYDALDGLSQVAAQPVREEIVPGGCGHGCGHNLLGAGCFAAAVAVRNYLKNNGLDGKVAYFGCPAEEGAGSKQFIARAGYFDDVDFVCTWHPSSRNEVSGKSSVAKLAAKIFGLSLVQLEMDRILGGHVGDSEKNMRAMLEDLKFAAPCVLWIDELEKALSHGGLDSGTSTRVFGSILTWMQEKTAPVFVVATANDVTALPPELLRRGRFDEIFFLDLPTEKERREIFEVHILKRARLPEMFDLDKLAKASRGFVGSEIEQAVIDAMYIGFNDKEREFTTEDILHALKHQVPISVSQREQIEKLRSWLREGRAQSASFSDAADAESQFVPIQLEVSGK